MQLSRDLYPYDAAMDDSARRGELLRRMAWAVLALVLAIAALSAFIRLDRAGLGCADWPACYGRALSAAPWAEGAGVAAARLLHRIVASTALLVVLVMALGALSLRREDARRRAVAR